MVGRKRQNSSAREAGSSKRTKFTLDGVHLPQSDRSGLVLTTGGGDLGQLGLGPDALEKLRPALVPLDHEIIDICAGGVHTVCLTKEGKVLTFGCNDEGALGRVTKEEDEEFTPGLVELPGKVIQISAGDSHTAALLDDGRVFAWGTFRDSHGNLGLTVRGNEKLPYLIMGDKIHVVKIGSGADHIVFLTITGDVYTCGCAEQGQLGRSSLRKCERTARGGGGKDQKVYLLEPAPIYLKPSLKLHFDNVWAGTYCTFAKIAQKKDILVFGLNNYLQLGLSTEGVQHFPILSSEFSKYNWAMIAAAPHHTLALDNKGKTYVIGRKEYGRLGLGENCEDAKELVPIPELSNKKVTHIGCGSATSFAVTDNGELYCFGMGTSGQLGTGSEDDCLVPTLVKSKQLTDRFVFKVASGGQHTVILASNSNNNGDAK